MPALNGSGCRDRRRGGARAAAPVRAASNSTGERLAVAPPERRDGRSNGPFPPRAATDGAAARRSRRSAVASSWSWRWLRPDQAGLRAVAARSIRSQRCRESALTGVAGGTPGFTPEGLEGPQRAAVRPTWTVNGLRTATSPANDGSGGAMRPSRRREGLSAAAAARKKSQETFNSPVLPVDLVLQGGGIVSASGLNGCKRWLKTLLSAATG